MKYRVRYLAVFWLMIAFAAPAQAAWHEASSDHFVIYSDSRAGDVEGFAIKLERYHKAMEDMTGRKVPVPSPSNRVVIFAVGSDRNLREIYGDKDANVAGFYIPRAGGSRAFVPNIRIGSGEPDFSFTVLLHEYAHHFLISSSRHAMPRWVSEGSAEFFASARFPSDGSVQIGLPNNSRAGEIRYAGDVPLRELLDAELYSKNRGDRYDAFYGRSWLLFHYLMFSDERGGQLPNYLRGVAGGMTSMDAADAVFGDLDRLESELTSYFRRRRIPAMSYTAEQLPIGDVSVRKLSEGMAEMMQVKIRSQRGVDEEEALALLPQARAIAAEFPSDAAVLASLAEAEYDAKNDAEAIAAADRAIAIDPTVKLAYLQKGYALFRLAEDADDKAAAYEAAMEPFGALNKLENDHPLPLIYYYRSFANRGISPPENARHALERASEVALFDKSLVVETALMLAREGQVGIAAYMLGPVAANPHGGGQAAQASALIEALIAAPEGRPFFVSSVIKDVADNQDDGSPDDDGGKDTGVDGDN